MYNNIIYVNTQKQIKFPESIRYRIQKYDHLHIFKKKKKKKLILEEFTIESFKYFFLLEFSGVADDFFWYVISKKRCIV
jgi:hypothetical protein